MGEIIPGIAVLAVVLADRSPLPLAEVRTPFLPGDSGVTRVVEAFLFGDIDNFSRHFSFPPILFKAVKTAPMIRTCLDRRVSSLPVVVAGVYPSVLTTF